MAEETINENDENLMPAEVLGVSETEVLVTAFQILEGDVENPVIVSINGLEQEVNLELWAIAMAWAESELGWSVGDVEYVGQVFERYQFEISKLGAGIEEVIGTIGETIVAEAPSDGGSTIL